MEHKTLTSAPLGLLTEENFYCSLLIKVSMMIKVEVLSQVSWIDALKNDVLVGVDLNLGLIPAQAITAVKKSG